MARIKVDLPENYSFSVAIPIRITDINYGGHVGNDAILSLVHEARMLYLKTLGYTELDFGGLGLIMADAAIEFKTELFYGDPLTISLACGDFTRIGFDIYYRLAKNTGDRTVLAAAVKTGMVCFDYERKKVVALPDEVRVKLEQRHVR
jgi:acyl-CoA thioesterase FadM